MIRETSSKSRVARLKVQQALPVPETKELGKEGFEEFAKAELDSDWGSLDSLLDTPLFDEAP